MAYNHKTGHIYGGSQGRGVARSTDGGKSWHWCNQGLAAGGKIIPQIEVDPDQGTVYILLDGDKPEFSNQKKTGIYVLKGDTWHLMRNKVHRPKQVDKEYELWYYPTAFSIDFDDLKRRTMWLVDYEHNFQWLATGVWKTEDGGVNWYRKMQYTHPTDVSIDPRNSNSVHIGGRCEIDGSWGEGGAWYTLDGGKTWKKNRQQSLEATLTHVTFIPDKANKILYGFFG